MLDKSAPLPLEKYTGIRQETVATRGTLWDRFQYWHIALHSIAGRILG